MRKNKLFLGAIATMLVFTTGCGKSENKVGTEDVPTNNQEASIQVGNEQSTVTGEEETNPYIPSAVEVEEGYVPLWAYEGGSDYIEEVELGKDYKFDLDGDGQEEDVLFDKDDMGIMIVINGDLYDYYTGIDTEKTKAYIVDLNTANSMKELCICTETDAKENLSYLCNYINGEYNVLSALGKILINGKGGVISKEKSYLTVGEGLNLSRSYKLLGDGATLVPDLIGGIEGELYLYGDTRVYTDQFATGIEENAMSTTDETYIKSATKDDKFLVTTLKKDTKVKCTKVYLGMSDTMNEENISQIDNEILLVYVVAEDGTEGWIDTCGVYKEEHIFETDKGEKTNGIFYPINISK